MNAVMIVPTGLGCEIGGHAGDANAAARLLAACCDTLIVHPNVVNASDINEMTDNMLYVEGSLLDKFLRGEIQLRRVNRNRVLVAVNPPLKAETVNAVSAARATLGLEAEVVVLNTPLVMQGRYDSNGVATGEVTGWRELLEQVGAYDFDALAVTSPIDVDFEVADRYFALGGVNPWGGVEAIASRMIAGELLKPVAHAPIESGNIVFKEIADPRMAAELISQCYLHCVLKGLHRAPRIGPGLSVQDIDYLISPFGCTGEPHKACRDAGIPVIVVRENTCVLSDAPLDNFIYVESYLDAAGLLMCERAGVSLESVRRPLAATTILPGGNL